MAKEFYRIKEVCEKFGFSRWTVGRYIKKGIFRKAKSDHMSFITSESVDASADALKREADAK